LKEINSSIKILIASCLILALTVPNAASAELLFPTDTNKFVIDEADVLTQTEEDALSEDLAWLEGNDGWGTEIVVVIIESTAHYQMPDQLSDNSTNGTSDNSTNGTSDNSTNGTSNNSTNGTSDNSTNGTSEEPMMGLQEYSEALFDEWQVGDQEWKDGILLVLSINQSEDDYKWWFVTGIFWDKYWVFNDIGATADDNVDAKDWSTALSIITDDLVTAVDDFWYENDGYVDPPGEKLGEDYSLDGAADTLLGTIVCLGLIVAVVVVVVLVSRSRGGSSRGGGSSRSGDSSRSGGSRGGRSGGGRRR